MNSDPVLFFRAILKFGMMSFILPGGFGMWCYWAWKNRSKKQAVVIPFDSGKKKVEKAA